MRLFSSILIFSFLVAITSCGTPEMEETTEMDVIEMESMDVDSTEFVGDSVATVEADTL